MSKPVTVAPDAERMAIDFLSAELAARGEDVTCGVNLPSSWERGTKPHVQVALDGTPTARPPLWLATIRATVWHESPTRAKRLAAVCEGLLLAHPGSPGWAGCRPGTGVLPGKDPDTGAQLASITALAKLRGSAL